ncbi:MAG: STAS domain-containing protein [Pseudomonadota bacterium]
MNMDLTVEKKFTIYEVSEIREKILSMLNSGQPVRMDLSRVTECDTAGVQLLCSILRPAAEENAKITIRTLSKAITDAAGKIGIELSAGSVKSM